MPKVVNAHDAKNQPFPLAKRDATRKGIVVTRNGKPVAEPTRPPSRRGSTLLGAFKGKIHMAEDFDATLLEFEPYSTGF